MKKKKIFLVAGARPNFMKIAPLWKELVKYTQQFEPIIVHTGQHYDEEMSDVFFYDLELPPPDIYLGIGSGTHAEQTAKIMLSFEKVATAQKPDLIIVVGDVNSTLACSIVAVKLGISIAHVEAGLRSFDRTMPEEINRIVTDALSDYLFTSCRDADNNLLKEGIDKEKIFFVGNVMIDSLLLFKKKVQNEETYSKYNVQKGKYGVLTLHRPSNVDTKENFINILNALREIVSKVPIIFPCHPRTQKQIQQLELQNYFTRESIRNGKILLIEPMGYKDFLNLMLNSQFILTDSGGIQEETTVLQIPCLTLRKNTERPVTVTQGTNVIVGNDTEKIISEVNNILAGKKKKGTIPELWDGKSAERIVNILLKKLYNI